MSKADFLDLMSEKYSMTKKDANLVVEKFTETVISSLQEGKEVQLIGFGTFSVADIPAREGRNPRTGEPLQVRAHKQPKFKSGQKLKDACNI